MVVVEVREMTTNGSVVVVMMMVKGSDVEWSWRRDSRHLRHRNCYASTSVGMDCIYDNWRCPHLVRDGDVSYNQCAPRQL